MPETMPVIKTLVIGLGSTGTRICDVVAERIQWELGRLDRAPWVQFLCIETDVNEPSQLNQRGDFRTLSLSAQQYRRILSHPADYDESIRLSEWSDKGTLEKLPGEEVSAGAGNIRMVGRVAFLFPENYIAIKQAVQDRLNVLRSLTEAEATERRGSLPDGSQPNIEFRAGGHLRIFVVGTLCGGTCSGIAADFGFFLKTMCTSEEKIIGIFTLPRPDLTRAVEGYECADRYKRNAYCALEELNHFCLSTDRGQENPLRFYDVPEVNTRQFPYDLPYCVLPRQVGKEYEKELNRAVGERIFLNIFVPETDPFGQTVNATIFDRENQAHVFCTFGISTVEFPAQQVIEACSKRLLAYTLRNWQNRSVEKKTIQDWLNEMGLTWNDLVENLAWTSGGVSLRHLLEQKKAEVLSFASTHPKSAVESLDALRSAFSGQFGGQETSSLSPGVVPRTFQENRAQATQAVMNRLQGVINAHLLSYYGGPAPLRRLLDEARERLGDLRRQSPPSYHDEAQQTEEIFRKVQDYHRSRLLQLLGLKGEAVKSLLPDLREALGREIQARIRAEAYRALQDTPTRGQPEPGVLTRIERSLQPIRERLNNLMTRIVTLTNELNDQANGLAREPLTMNGFCIFDPETSRGGTVQREYERCLSEASNDPTEGWELTRERVAEEILQAWTNLPRAVTAPDQDADWLRKEFNPARDEAIPPSDLEELEKVSRRPFSGLRNVNVLERWKSFRSQNSEIDPTLKAREAALTAKPFLWVDRVLAEKGGVSSIADRRTVLVHTRSKYREEFLKAIEPVFPSADQADSFDPYRVVLLEEWYRFPLSSAPDILGEHGLQTAQCNDFPYFHSRKDLFWAPLSREEVDRLQKMEGLVSVAILLEILKPQKGALELPWSPEGFGDRDIRRLPLGVRATARFLINHSADLDGYSIYQADLVLERKIRQKRGEFSTSKEFLLLLQQQFPKGIGQVLPDWDLQWVRERLISFCSRDYDLWGAYLELFPPDIEHLRKEFPEDPSKNGYYCDQCGGIIGKDLQEAARAGFRCFVNPEHYFGPRVRGER